MVANQAMSSRGPPTHTPPSLGLPSNTCGNSPWCIGDGLPRDRLRWVNRWSASGQMRDHRSRCLVAGSMSGRGVSSRRPPVGEIHLHKFHVVDRQKLFRPFTLLVALNGEPRQGEG